MSDKKVNCTINGRPVSPKTMLISIPFIIIIESIMRTGTDYLENLVVDDIIRLTNVLKKKKK